MDDIVLFFGVVAEYAHGVLAQIGIFERCQLVLAVVGLGPMISLRWYLLAHLCLVWIVSFFLSLILFLVGSTFLGEVDLICVILISFGLIGLVIMIF